MTPASGIAPGQTPSATLVSVALFIFLIAAIFHANSLDGIDTWTHSLVYGDCTEYAPGFSDSKLRQIRVGMSAAEVREILGEPLVETWFLPDGNSCIVFYKGVVDEVWHRSSPDFAAPNRGTPRVSLEALGSEATSWGWSYSRKTRDDSYWIRGMFLVGGQVTKVVHGFYVD